MEPQVPARMGDGTLFDTTRSAIRADLEDGTQAAATRAKLPPLEADELDHLLDIFASSARFTAVDIGDEVVLSKDGTGTPQLGSRVDALYAYEQVLAHDTVELFHIDYSFKAVKTVVPFEQQYMKEAQERLTVPVHYGAQPDLGRYSEPDGPCGNWAQLLPAIKIDEARAAQEAAVELAVDDMVYVAEALWDAGADGLNFDTAGAAGDADLLATLRAVEALRARHPDMGIMVGMASEIVLGTHGQLEFHGTRLAGLKPAGQLGVVREAGATRVRTSREQQCEQIDGLEHGPRPDVRQALHGGGRDPDPHERRHGRGGRADERLRARSTPCRGSRAPASTFCGSTACRQARATRSAWTSPTRAPPA